MQLRAYNNAKATLTKAGSKTAGKSHVKHNTDEVPADHGKQLLREARDEFRETDEGGTGLKAGMTPAHHKAVTDAAHEMGITTW